MVQQVREVEAGLMGGVHQPFAKWLMQSGHTNFLMFSKEVLGFMYVDELKAAVEYYIKGQVRPLPPHLLPHLN